MEFIVFLKEVFDVNERPIDLCQCIYRLLLLGLQFDVVKIILGGFSRRRGLPFAHISHVIIFALCDHRFELIFDLLLCLLLWFNSIDFVS